LTRKQWNHSAKTMNFDGKPRDSDNFQGYITHPASMITVGVLCLLAYVVVMKKR